MTVDLSKCHLDSFERLSETPQRVENVASVNQGSGDRSEVAGFHAQPSSLTRVHEGEF
jgi:hypothetical protein